METVKRRRAAVRAAFPATVPVMLKVKKPVITGTVAGKAAFTAARRRFTVSMTGPSRREGGTGAPLPQKR